MVPQCGAIRVNMVAIVMISTTDFLTFCKCLYGISLYKIQVFISY